jgi:hypothetical protein
MVNFQRPSLLLGGALVAALSVTACAKANIVGDSGAGGTGGDGGAPTGGAPTGGAGGDGPCTGAEECASFSDACNTGACINGECGKLPANDGTACDDGKECTQNDYCDGGVCQPGSVKPCTASDPCMVGVCDVASDSCVEMPGNNGAPCNFGDACILSASCINGICQPNQQVDCSFLDDACATGVCDPQTGCVKVPQAEGVPCNDFLFCTVQDQCVSGLCKGFPNLCGAAVNDPCKTGVCNEAQKTCIAVAGNDGAACDDGNLCTSGETCSLGSCLGGNPANEGVTCDDANGCTAGTSCIQGACGNPQSEITACVDGDMCCPAGCAGDKDCLWWVSGVQVNIPETELVGWTECFKDTYESFSTPVSQILQQCDMNKLLMACRPVGATTFTTLAMAPRIDVITDTSTDQVTLHEANGVGWYFNTEWSWGYVQAGDPVQKFSCDVLGSPNNDKRLCWHTGGGNINGGYRCGVTTGLNGDPGWERIVYEAN